VLPEEEIVRICALVVATATGVNPDLCREQRRGNPELQYSRAIWVHLIACEMGIGRGRASYLCDRSLESIDRYLAEVEEWRTDETFSDRLDRWSENAKHLLSLIFDYVRLVPAAPPPSQRARQVARAIINERAA
jgi:hypothetical protein